MAMILAVLLMETKSKSFYCEMFHDKKKGRKREENDTEGEKL